MSAAQTEGAVDTSDLDLLDSQRHRACGVCYPGYLPFGTPFVGLCGRRVISKGRPCDAMPPDGCRECERRHYEPCARCGA